MLATAVVAPSLRTPTPVWTTTMTPERMTRRSSNISLHTVVVTDADLDG